ncbi:MAG: class I SAM-dependent methyltransferase [Verrucomicrobiota bacterium]
MTSSSLQSKTKTFWNAADYAANSAAQQTWARELITRLALRGSEHILDVGCGDGKVTAELACAVSRGSVVGIDASPEMIRFARETFPPAQMPNLTFEIMDARQIRFSQKFDLIFSNAALHWIDDHQGFLRVAAISLQPGGRLVISCGGKGNAQDVFLALRGELRLKRWRDYFRKLERPYFFYSPEDYQKWLPRSGFETRNIRLADKDMMFPSRNAFAGWFRTTWLPYTLRVPEAARDEFIAGVINRYLAKHPLDADGRVHVRMVRLEIDAVKASVGDL